MHIDLSTMSAGALIGIGATLVMDGWNVLLRRAFGVRSLDYCLLGRWLRHMPARFRHASIARSEPRTYECATGWVAHYSIGVSLALAFVALAPSGWLAKPTLLPALFYGIATVVFPFLVLQPSLGLGVASSKAPKPARARLKSLGTHVVFGCGLWLCALLLARQTDGAAVFLRSDASVTRAAPATPATSASVA